MRRLILGSLALICFAMLTMGASGCEEGNDKAKEQRERSIQSRVNVFERAERAVPVPDRQLTNFPLRKLLAEMTIQEDKENTAWYVYLLGENGNMIGYYVAKTVPVNKCNFLSSTEEVRYSEYGNMVLTAPSLDGIYYGGSGASGACDAYVFQDAATDALITIGGGFKFYVANRPLRLQADAIKVAGSTP
jgi:hypothetical protein